MSSTSVSAPPPLLTALDVIQTALRRLSAERDVERLYSAAVREAATFFDVRQCALALYDAQSGTFRFHWPAIGLTKAQLQALSAIPADQVASLLTRWPEHGVVRLFDAEYVSLADPDVIQQLDERDVLLALVRAEGQLIGALRLTNKNDGTTFSLEDIHLLGLFASQLGLQIRDLQLLAQEQKARRLAETLLKVPQVVHQPVSPVMSHGDVVQDAVHPVVRQVLRQAQYTAHQPRSRRVEGARHVSKRTAFVSSDEDLRAELTRLLKLLNEVIDYSSATVTLLENQRLRIIAGCGHTIAPDIIGYSWDASEDGKLLAMVESGQLLSIPDTYQDPRWVMFDGSENIHAWIGAPIWTPGSARHERADLIGVLNVDGDHVEAFTADDIAVAQSFADQMAIVLENQRLYLNMARRAAELTALRETSLAITTHRDLNELFNIIVERATALLNGEGGCIFQVDEAARQVKIVAEFNIVPSLVGTTLKFGEGVAGVVAQTGQPQLVTDYEAWPNRSPQFRCRRIGGLAEVPLRWQGRILGVLTVFGGQSDRRFTAEDLNLLALFADQAAIALENARLYKALEERVSQLATANEDLKTLNRTKDSLVQMVSHELRTPLTFIKGYVELLLEEALGDLNGEQVESLQVVAQRTDSIIRLVNDILSLARAESMPLSFQAVDLTEIARTSVLAARAVTDQANIHLETDLAAELPLVWGDPQRLSQVFDNLIGNAIKFSPDGSTISVCLRPEEKAVRAEVSDHGHGIPADELGHIWEHFYQVNSGTTRSRSQGSGLGLTIVKQLVEAHGGQVGVHSVEGEGSTFHFTVPYADTAPSATSRDGKSS